LLVQVHRYNVYVLLWDDHASIIVCASKESSFNKGLKVCHSSGTEFPFARKVVLTAVRGKELGNGLEENGVT
jgi:hypothetical protein